VIVFERAEPSVRGGEEEIAGRRIAARLVPYSGEVGPPRFRFDPFSGGFVVRSPDGRVEVGPEDPAAWTRAVSRAAAGPILVGPGSPAEAIRGAALAAAEGARAAGRPVYLLDPLPSALPAAPEEAFVAIFSGVPDDTLWRQIETAAGRMPAGLVLPVLPGWTTEEDFLARTVAAAAAAGAAFLVPIPAASDGEARRHAVEARASREPGSLEAYFDRAHHGDWDGDSARAVGEIRELAAQRGLSARPPRPRGDGEPSANWAAAARLEELADSGALGEHEAARLRAAARWIDELGRDLSPIVEEGNFSKIFPFGRETAAEIEKTLGAPAR
jgi:hypothetical protein